MLPAAILSRYKGIGFCGRPEVSGENPDMFFFLYGCLWLCRVLRGHFYTHFSIDKALHIFRPSPITAATLFSRNWTFHIPANPAQSHLV